MCNAVLPLHTAEFDDGVMDTSFYNKKSTYKTIEASFSFFIISLTLLLIFKGTVSQEKIGLKNIIVLHLKQVSSGRMKVDAPVSKQDQ